MATTTKKSKPSPDSNSKKSEHRSLSPRENIIAARTALTSSLVEREGEIDLLLTALLARENPLLVGPPGVAKSLLFDSMASWLQVPKFYYLLTKFTDPGEVFGPIDVPALTRGETRRVVDGYAPTAHLLCFDECYKASSAILNCLLNLLNEKKVKVGLQEVVCPLVMCVGLSNEFPNDDNGGAELGALFDRFLLRKQVKQVGDTGMKLLLKRAVAGDRFKPLFAQPLTPDELETACNEAAGLPWSDDAKKALWEIRLALRKEGIKPGDRRMIKSVGVARASAYLAGSDEVKPEHLEILAHVLWDDPQEQPRTCEKVVARIANPLGVRVLGLQEQMEDVCNKAEEKIKGLSNSHDREGECQGVLAKLKEIQDELRILKADSRRDNVLEMVSEAVKEWQYRIINVKVD